MPALNGRQKRALLLLGTFLAGVQTAFGASTVPTTWWPDPSTGLMWAGQADFQGSMNLQQAAARCIALSLGGYSDWRLPTLDEVKGITKSVHVDPDGPSRGSRFPHSAIPHNPAADQFADYPYDALVFEHGIFVTETPNFIWTSTMVGNDQAWIAAAGNLGFAKSKVIARTGGRALCVRTMEPDLLQIAKDAEVTAPVSNLQILKANVPLAKAQAAYKAGQYQETIAQGENSLTIQPNFAPAYWAIGIAYGRLGQWDQAVTNLEAAQKADKNFAATKSALQ